MSCRFRLRSLFRRASLAAALALLWLPAFAGGSLDARWVAQPASHVQAGKVLTGSIQLINYSDQEHKISGEWVLPPGWRSLTPLSQELDLDPGEAKPVTFALQVPRDQPSGIFRIYYQAESLDEERLRDQLQLTVEVEPQAALTIAVLAAPRIAIPGEPFSLSINVTNKGNCAFTVTPAYADQQNIVFEKRPEDKSFFLRPGERHVVTVRVLTQPDVDYRTHMAFPFQFEADDCKGGKIVARQVVRVEMLPPPGAGDSPYVQLPGTARFIALYDNGGRDYQMELEGDGWVDEDQTRRFGYFLRFPGADENQRLGNQESFLFHYDTKDYAAQFGDSSYGLSRLTEAGYYGRGLKVHRNDGIDQMGAYYIDDINPGTNAARRFGSFWRRQVTPSVLAGVNYLNRQADEYEDDLFSLDFQWKEPQRFDVRGEAAFSSTTREEARNANDVALLVNNRWWNGKTPWLDLGLLYAGPDYEGGEHDRQELTATVLYPLDDVTTARMNLRRRDDNLGERPEIASAGTEHLVRAEVERDVKRDYGYDAKLGVLGEYRERHDRMSPSDFDEESLGFGLRWTHRQGILYWNGLAMMGRAQDKVDGENRWIERYDVNATLRFSDRLRTALSWTRGPSGFRVTARDEETLAARLWWVPMDRMEVFGSYRIIAQEEEAALRRQLNGSIRWDTWYGHNLTLEAWREWRDDGSEETQSYGRLLYSVPFELPVGVRRAVGTVRGRVHLNGVGLPGVIVRLDGSAALTDDQGYYTFTAKKVGVYTFHIDPGVLKPGQIVDLPPPVTLAIQPGATAVLDLPIVEEASLTGRLVLPPDSPAAAPGQEPFAFVGMAELRRSDESLRVPVTASGEFKFPGLRPGAWSLRFIDVALPVRHRFERDRFELNLKAGEALQLDPRIQFQEFKLRMIDKGTLQVSP